MTQGKKSFVRSPRRSKMTALLQSSKRQLNDADSSQGRFLKTGTLLLLLFAFISCSKSNPNTVSGFAPDNSGQNADDRANGALTAENQKENESDLRTTQRIRQLIVDSHELSINAQNVKAITIDGKVTLRGPVKNQAEIDIIVDKAKEIAGDNNVINQLEFTTNQTN